MRSEQYSQILLFQTLHSIRYETDNRCIRHIVTLSTVAANATDPLPYNHGGAFRVVITAKCHVSKRIEYGNCTEKAFVTMFMAKRWVQRQIRKAQKRYTKALKMLDKGEEMIGELQNKEPIT